MAFEPAARAGRSPMAHQGFPAESARRRGERDLAIVVGMGSRKSSARDDLPKLQSRDMSEFCEHRSPAFRVARSGGERRGLGAAVSAHAAATAAGSYFLRRRESDETRRTGVATVCLRPVAVWDQARYGQVRDQWRARPRSQWEPFWEYGAFVDVRDVAAAVGQALTVPLDGHHRVLLCAAGIAATAPSLDLAARLAPAVPVTDPDRYRADPWAALMDSSAAAATLGWRPAHQWPRD